jgi:hypothetical protein
LDSSRNILSSSFAHRSSLLCLHLEDAVVLSAEVVRVENERKEILTQKCFEPTKEFDEKYSAFLSNKSVSIDDPFEAANHPGDPLSAEASSLKVEKQLVEDACNDARTEASSIQEATEWNYFKAQWKKILN